MTHFQKTVYMMMCADGRRDEAKAWEENCETNAQIPLGISEKDAREKATERVYIGMCREDMEDECTRLGIKIVKSRSKMEVSLVEALAAEYVMKSCCKK